MSTPELRDRYTAAQAVELAKADHQAGKLVDWPFVDGLNAALEQLAERDRLRSQNAALVAALEYIATGGEDWSDCCRKARAALSATKGK